jgi:hypothetical protein
MITIGAPKTLFRILADSDKNGLDWVTSRTLESGFRKLEDLDFLFSVLENSDAPAAEHALATEMAARPDVVLDHMGRGQPAVTAARNLQQQMLDRAVKLLRQAETAGQKLGAARLIREWNPDKWNERSGKPPLPLSAPTLKAVAAAIDVEADPATKKDLIRWYCRMGGMPAYRERVANDLGVLVFASGRTRREIPELQYDVYDGGFWEKLAGMPRMEATALDGAEAGRAHLAKVVRENVEEYLKIFRKEKSCLFDSQWYSSRFEGLRSGRYDFRLVFEFDVDGKQSVWRSEPVQAYLKDEPSQGR